MYVIAYITLGDDDYEVGADVDVLHGGNGWACAHEVGEPDVSAPGCRLKEAWLVDQATLPVGWSDEAQEALVQVYEGHVGDAADDLADFRRDAALDEDPGDYWSDREDHYAEGDD